jgi:protein-S-isoprenylcysteine O-methyltransferase Ste14
MELQMGGFLSVLYGVTVYGVFFGTFLYLIAFVGNLPVPKTVDSGVPGPFWPSLVVNLALLGLFSVQHSVMARPGFKRWWTRTVPPAVERSTYVLFASLVLMILYWLWQPMPGLVWSVTNPIGAVAIHTVFALGFGLVLVSTFLINHFELFGLLQVWARLRGKSLPEPTFKTPLLYKNTRHPLYLGFVLAFWAAPTMTVGHLLFAVVMTGYIFIAIWFEERDLVNMFGDQYRRYREQVSMLIPLPRRTPR